MHINNVRHYLKSNLDLMCRKSLINCHTIGVDSILFSDTPESRVRMFVAHKNHTLWTNHRNTTEKMSIGFHAHHCNLELHVVAGEIINTTIIPYRDEGMCDLNLDAYVYNSEILNGSKARFALVNKDLSFNIVSNTLLTKDNDPSMFLYAFKLHTIFVLPNMFAAWMVYEGEEDKEYKPITYTKNDLTKFDSSLLYKPMNRDYLIETLTKVYPNL